LRISVPSSWLEGNIASGAIEEWEGITPDLIEYVIPRELFGDLNSFPRFLWKAPR
jgi:hypothetical protein